MQLIHITSIFLIKLTHIIIVGIAIIIISHTICSIIITLILLKMNQILGNQRLQIMILRFKINCIQFLHYLLTGIRNHLLFVNFNYFFINLAFRIFQIIIAKIIIKQIIYINCVIVVVVSDIIMCIIILHIYLILYFI